MLRRPSAAPKASPKSSSRTTLRNERAWTGAHELSASPRIRCTRATHINLAGDVALAAGVYQVSAGWSHTCAVRSDHTGIDYWGDNTHGQAPATPPTGPVSQVSTTSLDYTCALRIEGTIQCWGKDDYGYMAADAVLRNGPYAQVSAAASYVCAIKVEGTTICQAMFASHPEAPQTPSAPLAGAGASATPPSTGGGVTTPARGDTTIPVPADEEGGPEE